MAFIFSTFRGRIAQRMAAGDREISRELAFAKFAKTSNGYWLAWNPDNPSRVAVLPPDHPEGEPCRFIDSWEDNPSIDSTIEYVESGEFETDPPGEFNLFIEEVSCSGKRADTGEVCGRTAYYCKACGKEGCAHIKKDQCSKQCFAGITCVHCGVAGQIGELRDSQPDPEKDLNAFYRRLLEGRQNQFELRFVTRRQALFPQIWLDGVRFGKEFTVDFCALFNSLCHEEEYFVLTCSCGEPGCAAIDSGVVVRFEGDEVVWSTHEPISSRRQVGGRELLNWNVSKREYRFDRKTMIEHINDVLAKLRRRCQKRSYDLFHPFTELSLDVMLAQVAGEPFDHKKRFSKTVELPSGTEEQHPEIAQQDSPDVVALLLDELEALNRAANKWAARNGYPLVERYPQYSRARQIGSAFLELSGFAGMQAACHALQLRMAKTPRAKQDIQLVVYGWAGIGGWRA